jgi:hypothetical protein
VIGLLHLGTIPQWLTVAALILLAWSLRGGQLGPANDWLRTANKTLREEANELRQRLNSSEAEVVALRATRDLEPMAAAIAAEIERHEQASAKRDSELLRALSAIADRLESMNEVER